MKAASALRVGAVAALAVAVGLMPSCTDAGLQAVPPPDPPKLDNLVTIKGQFCTEPAEDLNFPVKILILLDQSSSLQCTDQDYKRFDAINAVVSENLANPDVYFGFVGFSARIEIQEFTRNQGSINDYLSAAEAGAGPATDYQGALATAVRVLEQDMVAVGPAERARTRYIVVFMSDGNPEPRCLAGCEDTVSDCSDGEDNDGDGNVDGGDQDCANIDDNVLHPDNLYGVCNFPTGPEEGDYVDMSGLCPEYNQPPQILKRVQDILELETIYSVGDVRLNSVLLFSDIDVANEKCVDIGLFGYDRERAQALLQAMASAGEGSFRDVNLSVEGDQFLTFDFASLKSEQWLNELTAINLNARPQGGLSLDTDMDGLADHLEEAAGTDYKLVDSDPGGGDGYSDLFEWRKQTSGFDPLDATLPAISCDDPADFDGDGLRNCEEFVLETDQRLADTDADGMTDWMEVMIGTDPLVKDALEDLDFDGILNGDELRAGTDPLVPDEERFREERMRYGLTDLGLDEVPNPDNGNPEERHCYLFQVERVGLTTPLYVVDRGRNRIYLYTLERPLQLAGAEARASVACVEAFYNGDRDKEPADGIIDIGASFWDAQRESLEEQVGALSECMGIAEGDFRRSDIMDLSSQCLPPKVQLGDILYKREVLEDLVRRYVNNNTSPRFPAHPANVFHPTEIFVPDDHCVRPRDIDRMRSFLTRLTDECQPCLHPNEDPTTGQ